jgi:glutamyl-tRNA reductase
MGVIAARHLLAQGADSLTVTNRTDERAQVLVNTFGCGTLRTLQESVEAVRQAELQRSAPKLVALTPAQREAVEALTRSLTNKFLHGPLQALRTAASEGDQDRLETLREIFHLSDGSAQEKKTVKQTLEPRLVAPKLALRQS